MAKNLKNKTLKELQRAKPCKGGKYQTSFQKKKKHTFVFFNLGQKRELIGS